jgi:two-component system, LytTR family, sensor kinase
MPVVNRHPFARRLIENRDSQFWLLQFLGWSGLSVISYFSLNLWYDQPELSYVAHNLLQSLVGALVTWPMRYLIKRSWDLSWLRRLISVTVIVLSFAALWSVLRLSLFLLLTDETNLWRDFGGWLFPSIFIFLCWTALYHGIKYYQLAQHEHAVLMQMAADRNEQSMRQLRQRQRRGRLS